MKRQSTAKLRRGDRSVSEARSKELKALGDAVDRIAQHTEKLAAALRRLKRSPRGRRSSGGSRATRKK